MIVVDANVIAYWAIKGEKTALAKRLRMADPHWVVPTLCKHEVSNILWLYMKNAGMAFSDAVVIWNACESIIKGNDYDMPVPPLVLFAHERDISAYDAQYAVLARQLNAPLITEDKKLRARCPDETRSMREYLQSMGG